MLGLLGLLQRFGKAAHRSQVVAIPLMGRGVTRIQFDGALKLLLRLAPVPVVIELDQSQFRVAFYAGWIQLQSLTGGSARLRPRNFRRQRLGSEERVSSGQPGVCGREGGILRDGVLKELDALVEPGFRALVPEIAALEIRLIGIGLNRWGAVGARRRRWLFHPALNFRGNVVRCRALQQQHVLKFVVIAAGPEMAITGGFDQLYPNSDPVFLPLHRAFDYGVHGKLAANLWNRLLSALVMHHRRPGDNPQTAQLCEIADKFIGHAIGKVLLGWIVRKIFQGQDRERAELFRGAGRIHRRV